MHRPVLPSLMTLVAVCMLSGAGVPSSYPDWAYAVPTPANEATAPRDDGALFRLPGSKGHFTRGQISGAGRKPPADWYPGDHPPMPQIVAAGDPTRQITACAACHYPNGKGRPQNANLAGLNATYLARQLREMKSGLRKSAEPRKHNAQQMVDFAKAMNDAEITQAAAYYASLRPTIPIKILETGTVPKMHSQEGLWLPHENGAREPIGSRVIETPVNVDREQLRDPRTGFIAYVPLGAVAKGRRLASELGCEACHGSGLRGGSDGTPAIAGRSPSYLARQLYDFQQATRHGELAAPMQAISAKLTANDIVHLTAYAASLKAKP